MSRLLSYERCAGILRPSSFLLHIQPMARRGPRTFSGRSQVGAPDVGFWVAKATFELITADEIFEWRGMIADMQGGMTPYIFGVFDEQQAPTTRDLLAESHGPGFPHSTEQFFDTGVGYAQSGIVVTLKNDVDLRETSATFKIETAGLLRKGMYFSYDACLYVITGSPSYDGDEVTVRFLPPARMPIEKDVEIEFANPTILMSLAQPSSGKLDLSGIWTGRPEIELEESFDGLS